MATLEEIQAEYARRKAVKAGQADQPNWFQRNILPDDDPTSHNAGETAAALINKAGEAMTFGLVGDEADARVKSWLPGGGTYEQELARNRLQEDVLEDESPWLSAGAEVGGAVVGAVTPMGAIGTLGRGAGMGARALASGAAGAGMGATYGFMEGEGADERWDGLTKGAAVGGVLGAGAPAIGAGVQKAADSRAARDFLAQVGRSAPTADQLRAQGRALYDQVDQAGVQIKPERFDDLMTDIRTHLGREGLDKIPGPNNTTPAANQFLRNGELMADEMAQASAGNPALPFESLDTLRRHANTAAGKVGPDQATDRALGVQSIGLLDDFVNRLGPDDLVGGDAEALQTALPKAREMWHRMKKTEMVETAMDNAETYLSGPVSGLRNQIASILRNKKTRESFTEAERAALKRVSQGTAVERMLHNLGGGMNQVISSGAGGALGAGMGSTMGPAGATAGALAGAALGNTASRLAGRMSEKIVQKNADIARALIARGGVNTLPVASDHSRKIAETLLRRSAASGAQ